MADHAGASGEERDGLGAILEEVCARLGDCADLAAQVDLIVGFGGRLALSHGRASLTRFQHLLVERLGSRRLPRVAQPEQAPEGAVALALGVRAYGRIILEARPAPEKGDLLHGYLLVDAADHAELLRQDAARRAAEEPFDEEVRVFFRERPEAEARRVLEEVARGIDRLDPVLLYMEESTYTNVPSGNNLLKRGGLGLPGEQLLLNRLAAAAVEDWPWSARVLLFCLHALGLAGFRGEELNGRQLTVPHVHRYLDEMGQTFSSTLGEGRVDPGLPLLEKARAVRRQRDEVARTQVLYRQINGLSLVKEQRFFPRSAVRPVDVGALPRPLVEYFHRWDFQPARHPSLHELCGKWLERVRQAHDAGAQFPRADPVEELIQVMARAATEELASDIGMSRCLRSIGNIARAHDLDLCEEACNWPQADYFCAVVASDRMRRAYAHEPEVLVEMQKAISTRMCFNGWHYMPGHFPLERKPPARHYYLPPSMSDLTAWSDRHHRGHIAARVRHAIRSPGPVTYKGKVFPGFYDLRLMRCEGPEYRLAELQRANEHTAYLGALYQALLDHVVATGVPLRINAFTNAWYEEAQGRA